MKNNSRFFHPLMLLLSLCCAVLLCGAPSAFAQSPQVVKVAASLDSASASEPAIVVRLTIDKGYHINANPASASYLIPVEVKMEAANGVTFGKPVYPKGKATKFAFEAKPLLVYEDTISVRVPITAGASAAAATTLNGSVRYQACNDQACLFPTSAKFSVATGASDSQTARYLRYKDTATANR
jgi:hypothetical protein